MKPKTKKCINPACGLLNLSAKLDHCKACKTKFKRPVGRPRTCIPINRALLRRLRKEKGLKQGDIAKTIGCTDARITQFESGYKNGVPMDLLKHIALILEIDYNDLIIKEK